MQTSISSAAETVRESYTLHSQSVPDPLSYHKNWRAGPHQSHFWYDSDYAIQFVKGTDYNLQSVSYQKKGLLPHVNFRKLKCFI